MRSLPSWRVGLPGGALSVIVCVLLARGVAEEQIAQPVAEEPAVAEVEKVDFQRDIRPLLSNSCFHCHGPDAEHREGGLRLDVRDVAVNELESGDTAIVPGFPDDSMLLDRITSDDDSTQMPPADSGKEPLTPEQITKFKQWIAEGAEYQEHWAFEAPQAQAAPTVKQQDWVRNPIDAFILAKLEKEGLKPSGEADRVTLIRRVTFDLTGLPPTPAEVDAFLADKSPDAYEKLVDRLLASSRYGEHRARFWLDAARYGDTHGLHLDNYREIWPYRDWVIDALNNNMPFDQFVTEQLAGDLLPDATLDQKVATGFVRCHVSTSEGGSIREEVYVRNVTDRVETFGTVFMGMTTGCAACHDHKYDPIKQRDFYSLFAFFNSGKENPLDGNKKDWAPVVSVVDRQVREELKEIDAKLAAKQGQMEAFTKQASAGFDTWLKQQQAQGEAPQPMPAGLVAHFSLDEGQGDAVGSTGETVVTGKWAGTINWVDGKSGKAAQFNGGAINLPGVGDWDREDSFSYGAWINFQGAPANGGLVAKMNPKQGHRGWDIYSVGGQIAVHILHAWPHNALKVTTQHPLPSDGWHHVFATYDGSSKAAGVKIYFDGKSAPFVVSHDSLKGTTKVGVPLRLGGRHGELVPGFALDDVALYDRALSELEVNQVMGSDPIGALLKLSAEQRTDKQTLQLRKHFLRTSDPAYQALEKELIQLQAARSSRQGQGRATTLVMEELPKPKPSYILNRGEYDKKGDEVPRAVPSFLPGLPDGAPVNRLGLAQWLLRPEHPLLARVTVNRYWQQYFGTGIVETSEDFGSQGTIPSHPKLLDWLAINFRENNWDMKAMQRMIVTSATYRQSSRMTPESIKRDPENRLLARGSRFRFDAETIRDAILASSGLLVERLGGPSVKPYQPTGVWKAVGYSGSNTVNYRPGTGEALYRRSLYTFLKRTAPPPGMQVFDAPSRETCTVRRSRTNSPTAALNLMNDVQYVEAARALAARVVADGGADLPSQLRYAFRLCTARQASEAELAVMVDSYQRHLARYQAAPEEAAKLLAVGASPPAKGMQPVEQAAWTMVANMLLNLDETISKQ